MSQNIIALIIFLALVALAVAGTLIFSALVDRSAKRERARIERRRTTDHTGASNDTTQSEPVRRDSDQNDAAEGSSTKQKPSREFTQGSASESGDGSTDTPDGEQEEPDGSGR